VRLNSKQDKNLLGYGRCGQHREIQRFPFLQALTKFQFSNPYVQIQQKLLRHFIKRKTERVKVAKRKIVEVKQFVISSFLAPDLIPDKGLLMNAAMVDGRAIDQFIETYSKVL
jgi:hypothetical protein